MYPYKKRSRKSKVKKVKPVREQIDYDTIDEFGDLLIPAFLQHSYIHGDIPITKLRTWQHELLSSHNWEDKKNCIAIAPTSGGKTLIAEVAIAQLLDEEPYAKAIYTLPFVALAAEKTSEFENKFSRFSVRPFYQNVGNNDFYRGSIAICTYEKAHSLLNSALKGKYDEKIKLVVIDEVHLISDESRGVALESLILKLMSMRKPPRIIALTATLNLDDANNLAAKINGFSYYSTTRNTYLRKYISSAGGELFFVRPNSKTKVEELSPLPPSKTIKQDKDFLIPIVRTNLLKSKNPSVLIFVNTRNDTKRIASFLSDHLCDEIEGLGQIPPPNSLTLSLRDELIHDLAKSAAGLDQTLKKCFLQGIGYHHAGLLLEERRIVEKGIKNGALFVVVATTTLSAGVNIRSVSRVIIHSPYRLFNRKKTLLPISLFAQMAGRSGRENGIPGDVVIISRNQIETKEIFEHIIKPLPSISTNLQSTDQIDTYILQALTFGLATDIYSLKTFLKSSFHDTDETVVRNSITRLIAHNLISDERKCIPTQFGNAVSSANLSIEDGLELNESTNQLMSSICLIDDLHLIFLCTPSRIGIPLPSFKEPIWEEEIFNAHHHVISLITGKSVEDLRVMIIRSYAGIEDSIDKNIRPVFEKIYGACVLTELINETPISDIEKKFNIDRGSIQMLQSTSAMFGGQATKFCRQMNYHPLAAALTQFVRRISFGVQNELVDLMSIPSMRREIARCFFEKGYKTINEVATLTPDEVVGLMPHDGEGLNESDLDETANKIISDAAKLAEQIAILEDIEEEATWKKIQMSDSENEKEF